MGQRQGRVGPLPSASSTRARRCGRARSACGRYVSGTGTDDPSPYSGPAVFETGLLERSDWEGTWISAGKGPAGDLEPPSGDEYDDLANGLAPSPYLRKEFPLDKPVRRARMYATARGVYELYVNGSRVGDDVLAPGWTDYDRRIQYQTYDVTPLLAEGPERPRRRPRRRLVRRILRVRSQAQGRPLRRAPAASRAARCRVRGRHDREPGDRRLVEKL